MAHFEYITMVVSFVLAFAVSQLLTGWARQWTFRAEHEAYALHTVSSIFFLIALIQSIWGSWAYRDVPWTFATFMLYFASTLPLAGTATLIHPPFADGRAIDYRAHYFDSCRAIYLLLALWIALAGALELVLDDHLGIFARNQGAFVAIRAVALVVLGALASTRRPQHHWIGLGTLVVLLATFVVRFSSTPDPSLP